jgi:hypothetical protein
MQSEQNKVLKIFRFERVIIPVIIGLGVVGYFSFKDFDPKPFFEIQPSFQLWFWLFMAFTMVVMRDVAYMYRIRLLTDKQLSWRNSFHVIMLWEFASSVTPSVVGGSAVALFIVTKEGIKPGRATAIVMITALLDELFYIIMVPLILLFAGTSLLFKSESSFLFINSKLGIQGVFVIGYFFILFLTLIISYGVFF